MPYQYRELTVGELIEQLQGFPPDLPVAFLDELYGRYLQGFRIEPEDGLEGICIVAQAFGDPS